MQETQNFNPYCECGHLLRQVTKSYYYNEKGEDADKYVCDNCGKTVMKPWPKKKSL